MLKRNPSYRSFDPDLSNSQKERSKTCHKVVAMYKSNLNAAQGAADHNVVASMQDILLLLVPYLSKKDARTVFQLCLAPEVLKNKDNGVQKRAYKLLTRIVQENKVEVDAEKLFAELDEAADETLAAAKKVF